MIIRRISGILAVCLAGAAVSVFGQELPVVHYGTKEGLSSVFVVALTQGRDGRIWIAHNAGLSVYDGSEFKNWKREDGLLGTTPNSIMMDNDDVLWISFPEEGLQYMERDETFHAVPDPDSIMKEHRIPFLFKMNDGQIYGTGSEGYYTISKEGVYGPYYPVEGKSGWITCVMDAGPALGILAATEDGVYRVDKGSSELLHLPYEEIGTRGVSIITAGLDGDIWFLSGNDRMIRWNEGKWRIWDLAEQIGHPLVAVFEMKMDPLGNLWIATGDGLLRWRDGKVEVFSEEQGLSSVWLNYLLVDREGILWLATESGLDKISQMAFRNLLYRKELPVNAVWAMEVLPDSSMWIGTNAGIVVIDKEWGSRVITGDDGLPEMAIVDMKATDDGKVWILGYNGLHLWDGERFKSYPDKKLESADLWGILPVTDNELWVYSSKGIFILDANTGEFSEHPLNDRIVGARNLYDMILRKNGDVFVVGERINLIKPTGTLEEIRLPEQSRNMSIFTVLEEDDIIWFVTNEGLISFDWKEWKKYPVEGRVLFDMVKVKDGEFWLGCNSGIARFDGEKYDFFGFNDGIAVEECNTVRIDRMGRVWFGGKNVTIAYPESIPEFPAQKPLITRVEVGQEEYSLPEKISFPSRERGIEFHFSTPSFCNEQQQVFRYRMDRLEPNWSGQVRDRSVRYANLPPGQYFFEVQSRQRRGGWDGEVARMDVNVLPAFWQTSSARAVFILFLIASGFLISFARMRHLEAQRIKLKKVVSKQTKKIRKQRDELAELATLDQLTGLPNRRKFEERLDIELLRSRRYGRPLSLFIVDIDNFKEVNDSYGHLAGDDVLRLVAVRGREMVREIDFFARWGGDEFVFLLPETDRKQAIETSERLKTVIQSTPLRISDEVSVTLTVSGGISTWDSRDDGSRSKSDLFDEADRALYKAKKSGRDKVFFN